MTANHEHTPTMYDIRDQFIEAWAGDFVSGKVGAAKYFDRALDAHNARIEAAAEQRGAARALRGAAFSPRLADAVQYAINHESYASAARRSFENYLLQEANRADQEGDDE